MRPAQFGRQGTSRSGGRETTVLRSEDWHLAGRYGVGAAIIGAGALTLGLFATPDRVHGWSPAAAATAPGGVTPAANQITQSLWRWQRTERSDGSMVVASDPSRYTVSLGADGRFAVRADCNGARGGYIVGDARITFEPAPITTIGCPGRSQDMAFYEDLKDSVAYAVAGEQLILYLKLDGGQMVFSGESGAAAL